MMAIQIKGVREGESAQLNPVRQEERNGLNQNDRVGVSSKKERSPAEADTRFRRNYRREKGIEWRKGNQGRRLRAV